MGSWPYISANFQSPINVFLIKWFKQVLRWFLYDIIEKNIIFMKELKKLYNVIRWITSSSYCFIFCKATSVYVIAPAPYISVEIISIFSFIDNFRGYKNLKLLGFSHAFTTALARSIAPLLPKAQCFDTTASKAPVSLHADLRRFISASVSVLQ